jgi:hypothetical protein
MRGLPNITASGGGGGGVCFHTAALHVQLKNSCQVSEVRNGEKDVQYFPVILRLICRYFPVIV